MWWILLLVALGYGIYEIYRSRTQLETEDFHITVPDLPEEAEGFTICFLSDIHNEGPLEAVGEAVRAAHPDLVVFGGDMLHKKSESSDRVLPLIRHLAGEIPTVIACGNHEEIVKTRFPDAWGAFHAAVEAAGARWLQNEWMTLLDGLSIGGITVAPHKYYHPFDQTAESYIEGDMIKRRPEGIALLLAHDPLQLPIYREWGMDAVLSGHIHGGVVRIPFLGGILSPSRTFLPIRTEGLYKDGNTQMVVSRGIGNKVFLPRFWNRPHLPIIILHRGEAK